MINTFPDKRLQFDLEKPSSSSKRLQFTLEAQLGEEHTLQ